MNDEDRREVVFLDTNALHYMHLYLTHACNESLYPFCPSNSSADETRQHLRTVASGNLRDSLSKGLEVIVDLSTTDSQVEYSPVSELELIAGRARGRAIEKTAREGIPDRMWTRFHGEEINARLNTEDLVEIGTKIASLSTLLDEAGIQATVSDPDRISDVFDLAKRIGGLIYVGFADSVIYASALVAEADYLITYDDYLRKTVNRIRTGPRPYDDIRTRLRTVVGEILLVDVAGVTLPEATRRFPPGQQ